MPILGQSSAGFTGSSSTCEFLHVGTRNSVGILSDDGFTQSNPPVVNATNTISSSVGMNTLRIGVMSGSVAFARPDAGSNIYGGPVELTAVPEATHIRPLGMFLNSASGNAYENLPAAASGKNTYFSSQGTYKNGLYETQVLDGTNITDHATGDEIVYIPGVELVASRNGYLTPKSLPDAAGTASISADEDGNTAQSTAAAAAGSSDTIAILKMPADAQFPQMIYDQRI